MSMPHRISCIYKLRLLVLFVIILTLNSCRNRELVNCNCSSVMVTSRDIGDIIDSINILLRNSQPYYKLNQEVDTIYSINFSETNKYSFNPNIIDLQRIEIISEQDSNEVLLELQTINQTRDIKVVLETTYINQSYFSITINSYEDAKEIAYYLCQLMCIHQR
jgi:hypothetical protein